MISTIYTTQPEDAANAIARYALLPEELIGLPQWANYALVLNETGERYKKRPFQPNADYALSNDPATWSPYAECLDVAEAFDGLGFMIAPPYSGLDIDHCRDKETGKITETAWKIIKEFDSYTEVSPSGTGIRGICKGKLPPGRRQFEGLEMYDSGRFLTMTGNHLEGTPLTVEERTGEIASIHKVYFPVDRERPLSIDRKSVV